MDNLESYFEQIVRARPESRKGENGKVLVIGGSQLFHAASFWSAAAASKIVDMVHFSSPVIENNELMRVRAKQKFWEGIVVPYSQVAHYVEEDDAILIGPGMERGEETRRIVNDYLAKYRDKRWVVDGGALQEVNPELLNENMICTPNAREREILGGGVNGADKSSQPGGEGAAGNRQKSHSRAGDSTDENKRILEDYGDREAKENESQDNAAGQLQKLL